MSDVNTRFFVAGLSFQIYYRESVEGEMKAYPCPYPRPTAFSCSSFVFKGTESKSSLRKR